MIHISILSYDYYNFSLIWFPLSYFLEDEDSIDEGAISLSREVPFFIPTPLAMVDHLMRYETYARRVKRTLLFAGLWPGRVSSKTSQFLLAVHMITSIFATLAIMNFVRCHIKNLGLVTKGSGVAVGFVTIILKVIIFSIYRDNLMELHETLDTSFGKELANPELRSVLLSPVEFFDRPTLWVSLCTLAVGSIYFITPPISITMQIAHGVSPIKYRLPFPTVYPWIITGNSVLYKTQYLIEVWACCALVAITASTDTLFSFYIFQISSQLRTLSYRMNHLKATDNYHAIMKECALRHQTLIQCRDKLQNIYGPIILWILVTSALSMCGNIYQASQIKFDKALVAFFYVLMKLMQALLYGWYGLFLTTESESFRESVYSSGWPGTGERSFMSNICIMLMYKPLVLTACHFSVISLEMFIGVANTALSYFFLLRTLE